MIAGKTDEIFAIVDGISMEQPKVGSMGKSQVIGSNAWGMFSIEFLSNQWFFKFLKNDFESKWCFP